jgi:hypothetical protein
MQWLSSHHVTAATNMHATTEELLEVVFSVQSMLRPVQQESKSRVLRQQLEK